jgi:hypothetical protein
MPSENWGLTTGLTDTSARTSVAHRWPNNGRMGSIPLQSFNDSCPRSKNYRRFLRRSARACSLLHHLTELFLMKKCDRHPLLRQTDGESVIVPSLSSCRDHRGESRLRSERWITSPQPHGHVKAASHGVPSPTAYRICGFNRSGSSSA